MAASLPMPAFAATSSPVQTATEVTEVAPVAASLVPAATLAIEALPAAARPALTAHGATNAGAGSTSDSITVTPRKLRRLRRVTSDETHVLRLSPPGGSSPSTPAMPSPGPAAVSFPIGAAAPVLVPPIASAASSSSGPSAAAPETVAAPSTNPAAPPLEDRHVNVRLSTGSKPSLFEKFPALKDVVYEWNEYHERERGQDKEMSYHALYTTFRRKLTRRYAEFCEAGVPNALPPRVSEGWYCNMKRDLGVIDNAVASREPRRPELAEDEDFQRRIREARAAGSVAPEYVIVFDETNAPYFPVSKRVQAAPSEQGARTRRRVRAMQGGRETLTVCVTYSVARKGKLMFLVERCSKQMREHITRDFGDKVVILTRHGKWMNGTIHAHVCLPKVLEPFVRDLRGAHGNDQAALFIEDFCPSHVADKCIRTGEVGLVAVREAFFNSLRMYREVIHGGGTPQRAAPDQMFKVLKLLVAGVQRDMAGLQDDVALRPTGPVAERPGGVLVTPRGYQRRPTLYLVVAAWVRAWASLPQLTLAATFIRTEVLTPVEVQAALQATPGAVAAGLQDLAELQTRVRRAGKWLDPSHDFSGNTVQVQGLPAPTNEEMTTLRATTAELDRLKQLVEPQTLVVLERRTTTVSDDQMQVVLANTAPRGGSSSLAALTNRPTSENVHEYAYFKEAISIVLRRSTTWSRKNAAFQNQVLEFHFLKMQQKYLELLDEQDARVVRRVGGSTAQKPMASWIWGVLKVLTGLPTPEVDDEARRMLVDFNRLSFCPVPRFPRAKAAGAKAKAKAKAKAISAAGLNL